MKAIKLIFIAIVFISTNLFAQSESGQPKNEKRGFFEFITSGIYAYTPKEKEGVLGTEIHIIYWFNEKWGSSASYTAKFLEEETLSDIALLASYNPARWVTLNIGPNFGLESKSRDFEISSYSEAEINFRPNEWLNFGPVLGIVVGKNVELITGMHIGLEL